MRLYKLTDQNGQSFLETERWGPGQTHDTSGEDSVSGSGWLYAFADPLLAVLLSPIYGDFQNPKLWEADGDGQVNSDFGLRVGVTRLTTIREIELPKVATAQRVKFALLCALEVYTEPLFGVWANSWLHEGDRDIERAGAVTIAARKTAARAKDRAWARARDGAVASVRAEAEAWLAAARAAATAAEAAAWETARIVGGADRLAGKEPKRADAEEAPAAAAQLAAQAASWAARAAAEQAACLAAYAVEVEAGEAAPPSVMTPAMAYAWMEKEEAAAKAARAESSMDLFLLAKMAADLTGG